MSDILEQARAILSTSPSRWSNLVETLPADLLKLPPAPSEWSAVECLQHLIDTERWVFPARVEALLAGRDFPAFDPDSQGSQPNPSLTPADLAAEFARLRAGGLAKLSRVAPTDLARQARHSELGMVTLSELLHEWAGHDLMHTMQAERALLQPVHPRLRPLAALLLRVRGEAAHMIPELARELAPLLRRFVRGEYGIALGGAHAKGVEDAESDLDLYVFARDILPNAERASLTRQASGNVSNVVSWGDDAEFTQAGTDFHYQGQKIECWLRHADMISASVAECRRGIVKREFVTWTTTGFYNHCVLSDLFHMVPLEDPAGMLARWQHEVAVYPSELRQAIVEQHLSAAHFWPDNFHYLSAIERCDLIYVTGIVQQVVHNLIQVLFALNRVYFPGDKKLDVAIRHLSLKPERTEERLQRLVFPGAQPTQELLREQGEELRHLVREVHVLAQTA